MAKNPKKAVPDRDANLATFHSVIHHEAEVLSEAKTIGAYAAAAHLRGLLTTMTEDQRLHFVAAILDAFSGEVAPTFPNHPGDNT